MNSQCNFCGHQEFRVIYRPPQDQGDINVVKCSQCDLLYAHPFPENLDSRYDSKYFQSISPIEGGYENYLQDEPLIKRTFLRRMDLFMPGWQLGQKRRALDVGCATGVFLEIMREQGWETDGIEISDFAAQISRKKGFTVTSNKLEEADFTPESFDLITLWDVIEHLKDPLQTIETCFKLLKPNGKLVISTPDASAWFARLTGSKWMGFRCVGEHVYFFDRKTLSAYLKKSGFEVLKVTDIGKYLPLERLLTRLIYYTRVFRIFRPFEKFFHFRLGVYVNSRDTMCVVGYKK